MPVAVRPSVSAGLALLSAGVLTASPLSVPQESLRTITAPVALAAAAGSWANAPANLLNAVLNAPMAEIKGVQRLTAAMISSGSWFIYSPVNVLGADPSNPEMVKGLVDMAIPFPTLSTPDGEQLNAWFTANFPMNAGCTGFPPCPDLGALLNVMFKVPGWKFYTAKGYTFTEPITPALNPVSWQEAQWNFDLGQTGDPVPWYGQTAKFGVLDGTKALVNYLKSTPGKVELPTVKQIWDTYDAFYNSLWASWNPFVPQSVLWNPGYSISAVLTRPFSWALCPSCNPYDPFMPVGWKPGDWVPDAFTYKPASPTNPSLRWPVSHGPQPAVTTTPVTSASATAATDSAAVPALAASAAPAASSPAASAPTVAAGQKRSAPARTARASRAKPAAAVQDQPQSPRSSQQKLRDAAQ